MKRSTIRAISAVALLFLLWVAGSHFSTRADDVFSPWGAYGQIYEDSTPPTTISLDDADTFYPWVSATVGETRNITGDNQSLTIDVGGDGMYNVCSTFSFSGSANTIFHFEVSVDGEHQQSVSCEGMIGTGVDVRDLAACGLIPLSAGQVVGVGVEADASSREVHINHGSLMLARIGVGP